MKASYKTLTVVLSLFIFSACGSGSDSNENTESSEMTAEEQHEAHMDEEMVEDPQMGVEHMRDEDFSKISEEQANSLMDTYLQLKDGLVKSSQDIAKNAAKEMHAILEASGDSKVLNGIKEDAQHIMDTDEMEHIREHFELISENVYAIVKEKGSSKTIYKQFCPMAFDNEGAFWLSSEEEIRNPYFGDKMLKCGKVEETIAAK